MTIAEAISKLRTSLLIYDDDAVSYSDEYLYSLLIDAGSIVVSRISKKFNKLPDWLWSTFPVKLEKVDSDFFPCEDIQHCKVLQSTFTIPTTLTGRNRTLLKVYNGNVELDPYEPSNEFDPILSNKPSYEIVNNYLRIHNNKKLKGVVVKGIFSDIMEWQNKKYCEDTDTVKCYNLEEIDFPLYGNPEYTMMAFDLIYKRLNIQLPENIENQPN